MNETCESVVERLVIVVDQDLPLGRPAVSVTGLIVGASMHHLLGAPLEDADGRAHAGT